MPATILEQIDKDLILAMKAGEKSVVGTLRYLKSQIKKVQIDKREKFSAEDELSVLMSEAKKRKESITAFEEANRRDLLEKEVAEYEILQKYLPKQLTEDELSAAVDRAMEEVKPESVKDMGKVMQNVMAQVKGKADGKVVQEVVKKKLSAL